MKKVVVLMSTYNGEKYIQEQIESVLNQKNISVHLIVRDDGSSDYTETILKQYKKKGTITYTRGNNIGWQKSFMELVYHAPYADYYAFCDQDDIWLPNKLSTACSALDNINSPETPLLYASNLFYYRNGEVCGKLKLNQNYTKHTALIRTISCGCTFVFNHALLSILKCNRPHFIEAHDAWVFKTAIYFGKVIFDPQAYMLYRQHNNNQIGAKRSFSERIMRGYNTFKNIGKSQNKRMAAEEFLRVYGNILSDKDKIIISKFSNYNKKITYKIQLLFDNKYTTGNTISDIFLKFKIITNSI